jgi:hypothetical protein
MKCHCRKCYKPSPLVPSTQFVLPFASHALAYLRQGPMSCGICDAVDRKFWYSIKGRTTGEVYMDLCIDCFDYMLYQQDKTLV